MRGDTKNASSGGATLADALSAAAKDRLLHLRNVLEAKAKEAIQQQRAQTPAPWQQQRKSTTSSTSTLQKTPLRLSTPTGTKTAHPQLKRSRAKATEGRLVARAVPVPRPVAKPERPPFAFWDFPSEAAVREPPPVSISTAEKSLLADLLQAGAGIPDNTGDDLFLIIGLDFGTSSTKLIVRLPYEPGEPTIAIPAPIHCRSGRHPYLWQTVLWVGADGSFSPWPENGAQTLHSLKQGTIQEGINRSISGLGTGLLVTRAEAAVGYLAFAIRYVRGWLLRNRPELFRGRRPLWFVNLGMPTASYDDPKLATAYRRIAAAALQLARIDGPVTVEAARLLLNDRAVVEASLSEEAAGALGVSIIPEAAAEMTGFAKSARNAPGLYLLVDVGAMTLDVCMFRLNRNGEEGDLYSFMAAQVRPLGVDAFHWFWAMGKTKPEFVQQCDYALRSVVWDTKRDRDPSADNWKPGHDVPVFLAGGGAENPLHRKRVLSLGPWLKKHAHNDGIRLLDLPVPGGIELPEPLADFSRMAVAWGLSYAPTDIGRIQPMRDIEDITPAVALDLESRFISKDHV